MNQIKDIETRNKLLESIGTNNFDNLLYAAVKKQETDEEKEKIEKLCLEHGMTKVQGFTEIPNDYDYMGIFALKDLVGKDFDFADGRKRYFYFAYSSNIYIYAEALKKQEKNDAEEEKRKLEEQRLDELVEQAEEIDERCEALREGFMREGNFNDDANP